ncbi:MAG TPA: nucleoside triphosphate pyrophosphohydrolase [Pyrinomonadaceae bacterium]|jgi:MazG family protein|nr:nucleoside triphosphate pyrophosphohydrolase [Pyrinomonadaceae bacterium]
MSANFDELVAIMARLRAPGGCPWDREQTYQSLAPYLIEETYETFDAIQEAAEGNTDHLREELGDILLQVIFHSEIAAERGDFTIDEVMKEVVQKLVLRHPHVFGDAQLHTAGDVLDNWDQLKADQRKASGKEEKIKESILEDISLNFPALLEGQKLTRKAAKVGFDWENTAQVKEKIAEEFAELEAAMTTGDLDKIEDEIGDIFFAVLNLARKLDVDAETALKRTNRKFRKRFSYIEKKLKAENKELGSAGIEELDRLWNEAKGRSV